MSVSTWIDTHPEQFRAWLVEKRWFGDKSRTIASISTNDILSVRIEGDQIAHVVVDVAFEDGGEATYLAPMTGADDEGVRDALELVDYLEWLRSGFAEDRQVPASGSLGHVTWRRVASSDAASWSPLPGRVLSGEQSNTSVLYGDRSIVKVFRKLQAGINPDSEIVSFLSESAGFDHVPAFEGAIVLERGGGLPDIELAVAQAFVANQGDCWRWLPGSLKSSTEIERSGLVDSVGLLGRRTGELHVALGTGTGDAFAPEPFTEQDVAELEARLSREVQLTASMLFRQGALSHGESESLSAGLLAGVMHADALLGSLRTRVHGDYHLGQVLRSGDDFVIIDFEGEPSRAMEERREKQSPLKDVAGMLRSIDYAVATASVDAGADSVAAFRQWGADAAARFTSDYLAAVQKGNRDLLPGSEADFARSLDLFMIEKALYEVRYELDNRPDWLHIPLGELIEIARSE